MKHDFHERDDDLSHCKVCGGAEGSLPTHCLGRRMTDAEEAAVYAGAQDFLNGKWWVPTPHPANRAARIAMDPQRQRELNATDLTIDGMDAHFLAVRLRRLFAHHGYVLPEFAKDDASLIGIAGTCIGAILTRAAVAGPDFGAVHDKRMSELTPEQREDAHELWIREQLGWFTPYNQKHIKFLLKRLDTARGVKTQGGA